MKNGTVENLDLSGLYKSLTGENAPWVMRTNDGNFYSITPSDKCKPEDHGRLNAHVNSIEDMDGNVLWSREA